MRIQSIVRSRVAVALLAGFVLISISPRAHAINRGWFGGSGTWNVASNWSPANVPQDGDDVFVTSISATSNNNCYYLDNSLILKLYHSIQINDAGPGAIALWQTVGSLNATNFTIATTGQGYFDMEGGFAQFGTTTLNVNGGITVGTGAAFNSTNFVQNASFFDCNAGSINVPGTYTFNAGTFDGTQPGGTLITGTVNVGTLVFNTGSFNGGVNVTSKLVLNTPSISIGGDITSHMGSFTIAANQTINAGQNVSQVGGTITQFGNFIGSTGQIFGSSANTTSLSSNAQWILNSGIDAGGELILGADFTGVATYTINGGTANFAAGMLVGALSNGTFNQTGGYVGGLGIAIGGAGSLGTGHRGYYNLSGGIVGGSFTALIIGQTDAISGAFTQSNGSAIFSKVQINPDFTSSGRIDISGGQFLVINQTTNNGTFSMTGGVATLTDDVDGGGTISVAGGASLTLGRFRQDAMSIAGGANVFVSSNTLGGPLSGNTNRVESFSIEKVVNTINGTLHLGSNALIVDYPAGGPSPAANIRAYLTSGYGNGTWNGPGIESRNPTFRPNNTTGWNEASDLFGASGGVFEGVLVDSSAVLVKYTWYGDANLDGQVDVTDLGRLATNWQGAASWPGGDFNYDGVVDVTDLGYLATNWQAGVGNPLGPGSFDQALEAVGLGGVSVPEPASLGIIALVCIGMTKRRRGRA